MDLTYWLNSKQKSHSEKQQRDGEQENSNNREPELPKVSGYTLSLASSMLENVYCIAVDDDEVTVSDKTAAVTISGLKGRFDPDFFGPIRIAEKMAGPSGSVRCDSKYVAEQMDCSDDTRRASMRVNPQKLLRILQAICDRTDAEDIRIRVAEVGWCGQLVIESRLDANEGGRLQVLLLGMNE